MRSVRRLAAALLFSAACTRAPDPPALVRLGTSGKVEYLRCEDETRPVTRLSPREEHAESVRVVAGSRLEFAFAVLDDAPPTGFVHFEVRLGDRTVLTQRVSVKRQRHWFRQSVRFEAPEQGRLSFRFAHVRADGQAQAASDSTDSAWLALSLPRVYAPAAPGRVLVWISQDTLRADHLGAYGYDRDTSPFFDRRAANWVLFEDATASASWTLPSMTSQFTSLHPSLHGAVLHDLLPDPRATTIFQALSNDGFTVLGVTANDLITSDLTLTRGIDALWYANARAPKLSARLVSALDEWKGGDLALFIHIMDAHAPYLPPSNTRFRFHPRHEGPEPNTSWASLVNLKTPAEIAHIVALYDEAIAGADAAIDGMLRELEKRDLLKNAVIAYTSDHGEEFREHGGWQHGGTLYQETLHVPLALRIPGRTGARIRQPVSMVDLAPTLLDALEVAPPASFLGRSLLPVLAVNSDSAGRPIVAETQLTPQRESLLAWRTGPRKLIVHTPHGLEQPVKVLSEQLYDLGIDPGETRSVARDLQASAARDAAMNYLLRVRQQAGPSRPASLDKATLDRLRALGYLR